MLRVFGLLALVILFGSAPLGVARVEIASSDRVISATKDGAGWAALETLGRHHGFADLARLVSRHPDAATPAAMEAALDEARINYSVQDKGSTNKAILTYASQEGLGAVVGFRPLSTDGKTHFVTLVDFGPTDVSVIDPADGRVRTLSRVRFLGWWDGFALVLLPERALTDPD